MAFTEFYVQSGGSDLNAGSDTNNAAAVSVANAAWSTVTNIYTGLTGTEFAAVNVGDWVSIYLDAATITTFIAQITVVGALGVSITVSATARYGTPPTTGATGRSAKVGGAHAAGAAWSSVGVNNTTVPFSTRINWKNATYSYAVEYLANLIGATTAPLWHRGYNTTPGDCDSDPSLARPVISLGTNLRLVLNGAHQLWSSFDVSGSNNGTVINIAGAFDKILRLKVTNAASGVNARAVAFAIISSQAHYCWATAPSTAVNAGIYDINVGGSNGPILNGCVASGGGRSGFESRSTDSGTYYNCIALNPVIGFQGLAPITLTMVNCTVYTASSDGVRMTAGPTESGMIIGCLFSNISGYGINNSSGTNTNTCFRACNDYYSITSGNENGFGDSPAFFGQTESSSPFINTGTSNFGIVSSANAIAKSFAPGGFEQIPNTVSYSTIGAVQAQGSTGTGFVPQVFE